MYQARSHVNVVHKFGYNLAVPNGSWAGVLSLTGAFPWLEAATTVRVKAGGDVADTAAGAGARTVIVEGVDATGAETSDSLTLAGASASASTSVSFFRVFRVYVATAGDYTAANVDAIVIENTAGTVDLIGIPADEGQSQHCSYTIPAGVVGELGSLVFQSDGAKAADFRIRTRESVLTVTAPYAPKRTRFSMNGVLGQIVVAPQAPMLSMPALTDVWVEAYGGGAQTEVAADMEIILRAG